MRVTHDVMRPVHFLGIYLHPPKYYFSYHLFNLKMYKNQFDANDFNGIAIDVVNNVLPI